MATTPPAKKLKTDTKRKPCPYGAVCYRKNPVHFQEFCHPGDKDHDASTAASSGGGGVSGGTSGASALTTTSTAALPPCKYGVHCFRRNLLHFAEFSHPYATAGTSAASTVNDEEGDSDTDICSDSEDDSAGGKAKKSRAGKKTGDGPEGEVLKRGPSLVKSFSKMTEQERRELVVKALAAKEALQKEVEAVKKEVQEKDRKLCNLSEQLRTGVLMMDGEKEALEGGGDTVYFPLGAERQYKEGSAAQIHYRLAESQFYRLLSGQSSYQYRVTKVDYVVTPHLVKRFRAAQEKLKKVRGEEWSAPVLGFHGTMEKNIQPICEMGFRVPGEDGFTHRTDSGYYGAGVYFSEYPSYSMGYIAGSQKLLLCQVLPGKTYQCHQLIHGAKLMAGYDSHMSPNKKELVIFSSHHILPCYIVYYTPGAVGDFTYSKTRQSKHRRKVPQGADAVKFHAVPTLTKRMMANNAVPSKALEGKSFLYSGSAAESKNLFKLITQHKGKKGTSAKFDVLVAVAGVTESNKTVTKALDKDLPVVTEDFVYECILHKKWLDPDYFLHGIYDQ